MTVTDSAPAEFVSIVIEPHMPEPHEEARGHFRVVLVVTGEAVPTDIVGTSPKEALTIFAARLIDHRVGDWPLKR